MFPLYLGFGIQMIGEQGENKQVGGQKLEFLSRAEGQESMEQTPLVCCDAQKVPCNEVLTVLSL